MSGYNYRPASPNHEKAQYEVTYKDGFVALVADQDSADAAVQALRSGEGGFKAEPVFQQQVVNADPQRLWELSNAQGLKISVPHQVAAATLLGHLNRHQPL